MGRHFTLGLPLAERRGAWLACAAVLLGYLVSMQRGLGAFDSPELALVARTLGLGHPPGQPLHTLLGFAFSHLPGVPPLAGLNALSALAGALTLLPVMCLGEWLLARHASPGPHARRYLRGSVALLALHGALWEPATRIEVYPLATLFACWALAFTVTRIDGAALPGGQPDPTPLPPGRVLCVAGLLLGLSASANPMIAALAALAMGPGLLSRLGRRQLDVRAFALAVLGGGLGLLPYGYVFVVAHRADVLVWGRPLDAQSLHHYFSFADFAQNNRLRPGELAAHALEWLAWTATQGILPILACGIGAFAWLARGRGLGPSLALGSALWTGLFIASNVVWRLDNPDLLAYLGVPFALGSAGLAALVGRLSVRPGRAPLALGGVLLLVLVAPTPLPLRTRHLDRVTDTLAAQTLAELPPHAILVTESDHLGAAVLYLQLAEGVRRDVVHVAYGLASSSWFWELGFRLHPELSPIELRGPGGKPARVRRLFAANPERPVYFERSELALSLTPGPLCVAGWSAGTAGGCERVRASEPAAELEAALATLGDGSPSTQGLLAMVALELGVTRWRAGQGGDALATLRAGVPAHLQPALSFTDAARLDAAPPPPPGWPRWRRPALLGEPARNLFVSSALLHAAGAEAAARAHLEAARVLGLPEALATVAP